MGTPWHLATTPPPRGSIQMRSFFFLLAVLFSTSALADDKFDQATLEDTVTFWVREKVFSSLNSAKIRMFN